MTNSVALLSNRAFTYFFLSIDSLKSNFHCDLSQHISIIYIVVGDIIYYSTEHCKSIVATET